MPFLSPLQVYDIIISHVLRDERKKRLFGDCSPIAREAFISAILGDEFSWSWLEIPLIGKPCFDLHVSVSQESIDNCENFPSNLGGGGFEEAFLWSRGRKNGKGLIFGFDVSKGNQKSIGLQCLGNGHAGDESGFFSALGNPKAMEGFRVFLERMPETWEMLYFGFFMGRTGPQIRIDCGCTNEIKNAYAKSPELFKKDLIKLGFTAISDKMLYQACRLASYSFPLNLQFDVGENGIIGNTIGISPDFKHKFIGKIKRLDFSSGSEVDNIIKEIQSWGIADDRCRLLGDVVYMTRFLFNDWVIDLLNLLGFIKVRWRDGEPLDSKAYYEMIAKQSQKT